MTITQMVRDSIHLEPSHAASRLGIDAQTFRAIRWRLKNLERVREAARKRKGCRPRDKYLADRRAEDTKLDERDAERLIGDTRGLAIRSRLDPRADIGLGEIHLPELEVLGVGDSQVEAIRAP